MSVNIAGRKIDVKKEVLSTIPIVGNSLAAGKPFTLESTCGSKFQNVLSVVMAFLSFGVLSLTLLSEEELFCLIGILEDMQATDVVLKPVKERLTQQLSNVHHTIVANRLVETTGHLTPHLKNIIETISKNPNVEDEYNKRLLRILYNYCIENDISLQELGKKYGYSLTPLINQLYYPLCRVSVPITEENKYICSPSLNIGRDNDGDVGCFSDNWICDCVVPSPLYENVEKLFRSIFEFINIETEGTPDELRINKWTMCRWLGHDFIPGKNNHEFLLKKNTLGYFYHKPYFIRDYHHGKCPPIKSGHWLMRLSYSKEGSLTVMYNLNKVIYKMRMSIIEHTISYNGVNFPNAQTVEEYINKKLSLNTTIPL